MFNPITTASVKFLNVFNCYSPQVADYSDQMACGCNNDVYIPQLYDSSNGRARKAESGLCKVPTHHFFNLLVSATACGQER